MKSNSIFASNSILAVKRKKAIVKWIVSVIRIIVLLAIGYVILYPLLHMLITSIRSKESFMNASRIWIPDSFAAKENYKIALEILDYNKSIWATLKYQIVSALLEVVSCSIAAYGFARFKFKLKGLLIVWLFLTILIPDIMVIMPRVVNFSRLDFLGILGLFNKITGIDLRPNVFNTGFAFWLPSLFGIGLRSGILIYIYIQFFKGLPAELEEAAWVDGAGPIRTFLSIAVPSSGVVILTVTVFSLIWHYNDYLLSSMYLSADYPLAVYLNMMLERLPAFGYLALSPKEPETMAFLMAGCTLFVTPMLIVYMILQRWFIESIDRVGITG